MDTSRGNELAEMCSQAHLYMCIERNARHVALHYGLKLQPERTFKIKQLKPITSKITNFGLKLPISNIRTDPSTQKVRELLTHVSNQELDDSPVHGLEAHGTGNSLLHKILVSGQGSLRILNLHIPKA